MIEKMAVAFFESGDTSVVLYSVGVYLLAGLISVVKSSPHYAMTRGPYWAMFGMQSLFLLLAGFVWVYSVDAFLGGYMWAILLIYFASLTICGSIHGWMSVARAVDIYEQKWKGLYGFVPILNLILLFGSSGHSLQPENPGWTDKLRGALGVFVGIISIVVSRALEPTLFDAMDERAQDVQMRPDFSEKWTAAAIRNFGVGETLLLMADATQTPIDFGDGVTILQDVTAQNETLIRTFLIRDPDFFLDPYLETLVKDDLCSIPSFLVIFENGGTIQEVYTGPEGADFGAMTVTYSDCPPDI